MYNNNEYGKKQSKKEQKISNENSEIENSEGESLDYRNSDTRELNNKSVDEDGENSSYKDKLNYQTEDLNSSSESKAKINKSFYEFTRENDTFNNFGNNANNSNINNFGNNANNSNMNNCGNTITNYYALGSETNFRQTQSMGNSKKIYALENIEECSEFVAEKRESRYFLYALIMSLFDMTPVDKLNYYIRTLYKLLPKNETNEDNQESKEVYLSQFTILNTIGGIYGEAEMITHVGKIKSQCICYNDYIRSRNILENFWRGFPELQDIIIYWLISISKKESGFGFKQLVSAFVKIFEIDFTYGIKYIMPRLTKNSENTYLVFGIIRAIIENESFSESINNLLKHWCESQKWLWRIPLLIYTEGYEGAYKLKIEKIIISKIHGAIYKSSDKNISYYDLEYIGLHLITSYQLQTLVYENLFKIFNENNFLKRNVATLYLFFIYESYYNNISDNYNLPLVICNSDEQFKYIRTLINYIISCFNLKSIFFELLYKIIIRAKNSNNETNHIKHYFQRIAFSNKLNYEAIITFLKSKGLRDCLLAKDIILMLQNILTMANKKLLKK